jgi:hypothetical protein
MCTFLHQLLLNDGASNPLDTELHCAATLQRAFLILWNPTRSKDRVADWTAVEGVSISDRGKRFLSLLCALPKAALKLLPVPCPLDIVAVSRLVKPRDVKITSVLCKAPGKIFRFGYTTNDGFVYLKV